MIDIVKRLRDFNEIDEGKINDARFESADLIERQREALRVARAAMLFYANPFERTDLRGDDVRVPDFYGELNFGETAEDALAAIDEALKEDAE